MRAGGLEPPHLSIPDPKSGAATNYATRADSDCKDKNNFSNLQFFIWFPSAFYMVPVSLKRIDCPFPHGSDVVVNGVRCHRSGREDRVGSFWKSLFQSHG